MWLKRNKRFPSAFCLYPYFWRSLIIGLCLFFGLSPSEIPAAEPGTPYEVSIEGPIEPEVRGLLEAVSNTVTLRKKPPVSLKMLMNRVTRDIPLLLKALKSQGLYSARVTHEIKAEARPIRIIFHIDPGPPYLLRSVDIRVLDREAKIELPEISQLGLELEKPAKSKSILDADRMIIRSFKKQGFPFPRISERRVIVDHAIYSVSVTYRLQTGPHARFGKTEIKGLQSIDETFLLKKIPWNEGEQFNADLLKEAKNRLNATGLFATVTVRPGESVDKEGNIPVGIEVKERKHRTIKTGLGYQTDQGPGGRLSWEHRNFFGRGENLILTGNASGIAYGLEGRFKKPEFYRLDQALLLSMHLAEDDPDAFRSRNITAMAQVERTISKGLGVAAGVAYRISEIDQFGQEDRFGLISLPGHLNRDTSDQLLDPSRGDRLNLQLAPYYDTFGSDLAFFRGYGRYSRYLTLSKKPFLILATRAVFGAMGGAERDEIPADIRFYAGGSGTIRGYAYQTVGPLMGTEAIGGRSLAGISTELRLKATEHIGFALFLDGGNAFEAPFPDFEEPFQWGAGGGFRYFTPVGPLRLDVGIPLNRRPEIDDSFQIYISLGQAF